MKYLNGKDRKGVDIWRDENGKRVCCVDECMIKHNKQGYCTKHFKKLVEKDTCTFEGCEDKVFTKSLCTRHYKQEYRHGKIFRTIYDKNDILIHENYAELKLYNVKGENVGVSKIDLEDIEKVQQYKWHLNSNGYVRSRVSTQYLHRYIMACNSKDDVDHINHDKLDNRKCNLRICKHHENNSNTDVRNSSTSIKGVYYHSKHDKYYASINSKGVKYTSKYYHNISDAILCREIMELYLHGKYSPKYDYLINKYNVISKERFDECVAYTSKYSKKGG